MQASPITKTFNIPEKTSPYPNSNPPPSEVDISRHVNNISENEKEKSPSKSKDESSLNYPSFSQYINPQRLKPYDEMLKKNIRSFNSISNNEKKINEENIEKNMKEKYSTDVPTIEINFKFTCDYELIDSELKEFLELFGEINSLDYDMNSNSLKVVYKYHFSSMYANYYLNHLIYENNKKNKYGNYLLFTKKEEDEQQDKKINSTLNEKQSEDIFKFIKFLTENYKSEPKSKLNETPIKSSEGKCKNKLNYNNESSTKNKKEESEQESEIKSEFSSIEKNDINSEKKIYSNIINNPKNLNLLQNSETPIKKSNVFNNYSDNNINSTTKNMKNNKGGSNMSATPLNPFNSALTPPFLYMPFVPKMNMKLGIPIPVLFPFDSSFLKKKFSENKFIHNSHKENKVPQKNSSSIELNKKENKINSCLMEQGTNNPINSINAKVESENSQSQNDNQIKEIFDNINNKIANISNNSNDSTNSNEKNNINNMINDNASSSNNKSNSDLNSSNKNSSEKSDSTIKTEKVNKSNNGTDELNRIIDIKSLEDANANKNNKSNNSNDDKSNNNKSSSGNSSGFMSSFKGKTLSLERLNNYLQENKPVSNFINPISFLNPEHQSEKDKTEVSQKEEEKIEDKKENNDKNQEKENTPSSKKNCQSPNSFPSGYNETNNYFNPMYNFLYIPTLFPEGLNKNQKNGKMYPPIPFPYPPPPPYQNFFYKNNPINFDKDVIDFSKLTLETKNKVHFMTHSSRNYYYKYVCNYTVQIENDNLFMVTKRIIGKNGCFLKKILQESCIKYGDYSTKIRLRGKGSGYVDKVSNNESKEEPLMLSVSSLNYPTYYNCCLLVDNLMNKIYDDYYEHLHKVLPKELHYSIIKKKLIKNEFIVDRVSSMPFNNYGKYINMDEVNKSKSDIKNENDNKKEENKDKDANAN